MYDRLDPELAWMRRASARAQAEDIFFSWSGTGLAFRPNAYRIEGRDFTFDFVNAQDEATTCTRCTGKAGATLVKRSRVGLEWPRASFHRRPRVVPSEHPVVFRHAFDGSAGHIVSLNESGTLQRLWSSPKVANGLMFDGEGRLWACLFGHGTLASFAWQDGALVDERTEIPGYQGQRFLKTNDLVLMVWGPVVHRSIVWPEGGRAAGHGGVLPPSDR